MPDHGLETLDYAVLGLYLLFTFGIALWFGRKQHNTEDFFLGGRRMPWFAVGLSILATLMSTISYLAVPGEMIRRGIGYFTGYIAIPFSMIVVLRLFVPFFMRLRMTSAYEYLERRFNYSVRLIAAVLFIMMRLGWMSMVVYLASMAVDTMKGDDLAWPPGPDIYWWIALVGFFAAIYTTVGGIKSMIWTDVLQFLLMLAGVLLAIGYVVYATGTGPVSWWETAAAKATGHEPAPFFTLDLTVRVTVVTAVMNMFFWTISTHGSDQVVLQRYFSTNSLGAALRSYLVNVTAEVTMLLLLAFSGLALLAFYLENPGLLPAGTDAMKMGDTLFTHFLSHQLPAGVAGLIMAGFLCDAMQTLESGVNAITAVATTDIIERLGWNKRWRLSNLAVARIITLAISLVVTLIAYQIAYKAIVEKEQIIDMMPKFFNMFLGPLAGLFFIGMFLPWASARSAVPAVLCGLTLSWLWSWWKEIVVWIAKNVTTQLRDALEWSWWREFFGGERTPTVLLAVAVPCCTTFFIAAVLSCIIERRGANAGAAYAWWPVMRREPDQGERNEV